MTDLWRDRLAHLTAPAKRLMAVAFLIDLAVAGVSLAAQFLAIRLGASPLLLGLLGMTGSLAYTVGCLTVGSLSDRVGRLKPTLAACLIAPTIWLLMGRATEPWHLLALAPVAGFSMALLWPAMMAWLAELSGDSRRRLNRSISLFNISWSAGLMLGPLLTGYAWGANAYLPFACAAVAGYACLVLLVKTPLGRQQGETPQPPATPASPQLVQQFLLLAWVGNFATWFSRGSIGSTFPKLGAELQFSESLVGTLLFVLGASQVLAFGLARLTDRWQYRLRFLLGAEALGLAGMLVAVMAQTPALFIVGFVLGGLCSGVTYVSSLTYALQGSVESRGQRSGWHEAVLGLGVVMGPLAGGLLAQYLNLHAPFYACAAMFGLAIVAQLVMWQRWGRPRLGEV
jgi:DHA1 family multidrug resistance protein-like MFS transporter